MNAKHTFTGTIAACMPIYSGSVVMLIRSNIVPSIWQPAKLLCFTPMLVCTAADPGNHVGAMKG